MPRAPLGAQPTSLVGAMREAAQLHRAGRLAEAISVYRAVIRAAPNVAEAHNNLAAVLNAAGRRKDALASYRNAVRLRPDYDIARFNMGELLVSLGKIDEGLDHLADVYLSNDSGTAGHAARQRLIAALAPLTPDRAGPRLSAALNRLASDEDIDLQPLARPGAALLCAQPPVAAVLQHLETADDLGASALPDGVYQALSQPLPMAVLSDAVFADSRLETVFTALRRRWLRQVCDDANNGTPPLDLVAGVALQAQTCEWIWPDSAVERDQVEMLIGRLADRGERATLDLVVLCIALYRPLASTPDPQMTSLRDLAGTIAPGPAREVLVRHLVEPREEAALAAALPRLTDVTDETSMRVQLQYEAHAYPRWRRMATRPARTLSDTIKALFPTAPLAPVSDSPKILVAGCGTGRHALATATRYSGAQVLAVDLSRASLGFAARQAQAMGVGNIAFAQADILGLATSAHRYDLIECSGTLHHMADPEAGWRALRGLLAPGGLMRISLYSERARADVVTIREIIAREGWQPSVEGIREARAVWRAPPDGSPASPFTQSADFYSLSGCRDLMFHEQEIRFDLPRIARALEALTLTFLGFELPNKTILRAFRARFPTPGAERDLAAWDEFEADNPTIFAAMYQFFCQAV